MVAEIELFGVEIGRGDQGNSAGRTKVHEKGVKEILEVEAIERANGS